MLRERMLDYYALHPGLGVWLTEERATGAPIGFHLLNNIQGETDIQVGYVLDKACWGKGYATEMCRALLRYGFAQLRLPRIVAITDLPNLASQRVLLKCGLHRNGERAFAHPAYRGEPLAWFERDAAGWLAGDALFGGRSRAQS
jgi:[ribosomal protein S5]-alanine N-acetyltransferase